VNDELTVVDQISRAHSGAAANNSHGVGIEAATRSSAPAAVRRARPTGTWISLLTNAASVLRGLFLTSMVLLPLGCAKAPEGPPVPVFPAKGKITFQGQLMPGASVVLHPKQPVADVPNPRANVGKDGSFEVTTFAGGDGAPEGEYVLTVTWYKFVQQGPDLKPGPNVIPPKYTNPQRSNVVVKIAAGQNDLQTIQL
jgi:hypothetical protein